ncbi:Putative gamma-glutamyltransferase YwrD [Stieleria magnilauensis]|uniref:Glutathione hydrolase proenzyme n=2 Tax=Stieleria magnilauensis TaxID=2527963 RepID=A0ABX5XHZ2_9BACT|nr:Putative gamma-glutamyltransferase YwrD [Planctomycetes bacterium TBK1r]
MRSHSICIRFLITVSAVTMFAVVAGAETPGDSNASSEIGGYDRPHGFAHQSRSETVAKHGMVATSHPLASQAGLDVLREGGNAVDAAIAANAMLGVVEPMSCGIGGDLFAIVWDAKTKQLYGLNASGRSPKRINRQVFVDRGLDEIPIEGPLSWSVPGCVSGWQALRSRFGTRDLSRLLAPSIETARAGFPVTEIIAGGWANSVESLLKYPDSAATYLIDGKRAPKAGEIFRNPNLAATYQKLADTHGNAFYRGEVADEIAAFSKRNEGFLDEADLRDHSAEWVDPVSTDYRGYRVWELPPNGQGIAALQMLNVLETVDLSKYSPGHPEYLHWLTEAKKLAFADRAKFYADMDFADVPVDQLISKQYGRRQAARINPNRSLADVPAGDPKLISGDTVYLTVVDKDRNCCSLIQSIYYGFGSQMTVGDLGFAMQNRGALFALDEDHLNRLEPGKRPFHTIIPAMVTRDDRPYFCFGVMGGDMQPQGHVQLLVNLIDFGMNVQAAGDAARVRHVGSARPTGTPAEGAGVLHVESGITDEAVAELEAKGHSVSRERSSYGGYQGILIDWQHNVLHGATEARKDGIALGY